MNAQDLLEQSLLPLTLNPAVAPIVIGSKLIDLLGKKDKKQEPEQKQPEAEAPPAPPAWDPDLPENRGGFADPSQQYPPRQLPLPPGAPDLGTLIPGVLGQYAEANRRAQERAYEFYPKRAEIDLSVWKRQEEIARQNALERMREKTKRDKELKVIDAWTAVTQAEINRETAMGLGMMNLSATLGMPNPNVLQASANLVQAGAQGFKQPGAVF